MKNDTNGFSLVELLVAFSIGIMVIVGGMVAGNNFNNSQKVDAAAAQVEETLRLAKNYAMTRQKPSGYPADTAMEYVGVTIGSGIMRVLAGNNAMGFENDRIYSSYSFDTNEVSVSSVNSGVLMFSVPEGKLVRFQTGTQTIPAGVGQSVAITVSSVLNVGTSKIVIIHESGSIQ